MGVRAVDRPAQQGRPSLSNLMREGLLLRRDGVLPDESLDLLVLETDLLPDLDDSYFAVFDKSPESCPADIESPEDIPNGQ
jgi:hypothetical protein